MNSKLLDFLVGSFPIIKNNSKISLNRTCFWQIPTKFGGIYMFLFKKSDVDADNVPLLMLSSKVGFIVLWCRTFQNFEWSLLQFLKYYKIRKINYSPCLITSTLKISPLLSKHFLYHQLKFTWKTTSLAYIR